MEELVAVENDVIIRLKAKNLSSLSYEEKRCVLDAGRPTTELKLVKKSNVFLRKFNPKLYEKYSWLCVSSITNELYCWPCLLFSKKESSVWSSAQRGYDDLNNLHTAAGRHDKTALFFVSYFVSQSKGIQFGDYFWCVLCKLNFLVRCQIPATSYITGISKTSEKYWT